MPSTATLAELDLFSLPPVQRSIEKEIVTEHRPIYAIADATSPITFNVSTADDEYINLRELMLRLQVRIDIVRAGDVTSTDWSNVSPVQFALHSFFKGVELEINDKLVTSSQHTYPYCAIFQALTGITTDAKNTHQSAAGWTIEASDREAIVPNRSNMITPSTVIKDGTGKVLDLYGKLFIDMACQPKALLGGSSLRLTLIPFNGCEFYTMNKVANSSLKATIKDIYIEVNRSKVTAPLREAHLAALKKSPARYSHTRTECKMFNLSSGISGTTIDNILIGSQARRAIVAFVSHAASMGDYTKNPYNFKHYDLSHLQFHMDGESYPSRPFTPNFSEGYYLREFLSVYDAYNQLSSDAVSDITRGNFTNGYALFAVNFAQDTSDGCLNSGHTNPVKRGNLRLELRFAKPLPEAVNALIFLEYDAYLEIDQDKNVRTNYM